ncbi:MAG: hypothetical protein JXM71_01735 [Spirochaetales bacterium]|nr:hypothetical protein [Spirochaetales bacterium]
MDRRLSILSETGRLRRVIVHTPGEEVEAMRPSRAEEELYNDIIPMEVVRREHSELKGFLSKVAEVCELKDMLTATLATREARQEFAGIMCSFHGAAHRLEELAAMDPDALAQAVIAGTPARHTRLEAFIRGLDFDLPPLPNTYFMRDAAMVYRDTSIASAMRFRVRRAEALIHRFVFSHHLDFKGNGCLFDGPALVRDGFNIEGGDFQVLRKGIVAIGVSERTSAEAVDSMARAIADTFNEPVTVFAVVLPVARATIHLDMAFTVIDNDACLVYEPVILGPRRARTVRIDAAPGKEARLTEVDSLLHGLKDAGLDLKPVLTGGADPLRQEREQWLSGANSFSFAPGRIIMYSCNVHTLESLHKAGFEIKNAKDFQGNTIDPLQWKRLAVGFDGVELARGGGGARCMTCPVDREE